MGSIIVFFSKKSNFLAIWVRIPYTQRMNVTRFFLLFLCVCCTAFTAKASCPVIHPALKFTVTSEPVKYDYTLDKAQIRVKSNASGLISGHVQGHVNVEFFPKTQIIQNGKCLLLPHVEVVITNKPILRIAKNYSKGSCEYQTIKSHEEKHIRLMNNFFKTLPQNYRSYLQSEFKGKGSVSLKNKEKLKRQLRMTAEKFVTKLTRDQKEMHNRNIDHPDKIAVEYALCSDW